MSDPDLLGFTRFDQHQTWGSSGRVSPGPDLDPEDSEDLHPREFAVVRRSHRWALLTGQTLLAIGNRRRDLVQRAGGLERRPATQGFAQFTGASLLRQVGPFDRAAVARLVVVGSTPSVRAGRDAVDVRVQHANGAEVVLGVDVETGVWTYAEVPGFTIEVASLSERDEPVPVLDLLTMLPDIDLASGHEAATAALAPLIGAVQDASGLRAAVLQQDEESETFRLVLLDGDQPVGLVSRQHAELVREDPVFGGRQGWISGDNWALHVDSSQDDPRWVDAVLRAIHHREPGSRRAGETP